MVWLLVIAALAVAMSNGANDNFKGFATVWGAGTLSYRKALVLATLATVAGSVMSLLLAQGLAQQFSGDGLVPDALTNSQAFLASVACGAAVTVFLATRLGLPVSTTHALIGALVGAGLIAGAGAINLRQLSHSFLVPLLLSPVLAFFVGWVLQRLRLSASNKVAPPAADCACLIRPAPLLSAPMLGGPQQLSHQLLFQYLATPRLLVSSSADCDQLPVQAKVAVAPIMSWLHVGSAVSICFARAVNDTPKFTALLVAASVLNVTHSVVAVAVMMAVGGLLFSRRVARTMSHGVTRLDNSRGLMANLVTTTLVLSASGFGLPVSTTHVAVGAIAGVGDKASGGLQWATLRGVLLSWVATLPIAMLLAWGVAVVLMK